ncbi:4-cresol dehydrogenase [hydroxylating] flavoprotein subunit [Paraburkholderia caribensis MBA4]|uniref:4-cresol dehydrogenase [hydroxylating] flavoprotein subunit n=1 Tax=Paraburkholderia caribensis MBA4 TaxID=1323664 RepID=A0A0P0R9A3_9BURK|nr:FAD-binding oxidoreductase [Paraburkholderia caribensis]ALL64928.1 4-cresol dehydrogenase [hydroxylating] flavoprotein subunit [Paraburkholderia caribensis MBA4]
MTRILPPDISAATFDRALAAFEAIVGATQVASSPASLAPYADPFAPGSLAASFVPSAALLPAGVDEIRAILRVANEYRIPLWTVSTGRNFAYGGAAPRLPGSVVLDLQRMNRILAVDEPLAYALVEPGVSYFDLHHHLRERGYRLWVDPPAAGWGSIIGNTLERGFGTTNYGDHAAAQCGMEVMLANGELVRTGMGGIEIGTSWQAFRHGYGPSFDPMFMQSNYGIVTKMGVWLMPAPSAYLLGEIQFQRDDDLEAVVETLRPLRLNGTIGNQAVIEGALRRAAGIGPRTQWYQGKGVMPESAIASMTEALKIGRWNLHYALYGEREVIEVQERLVRRAFGRIPGARMLSKTYDGSAEPEAGGDRNLAGIPGMTAFRMLDWRGGSGAHVDFSPVCPATGRDAMRQYSMAKARANEYGFDYYGGFTSGERHLHHIAAAIFDKSDARQSELAADLLRAWMSDAHGAGYGEYRSHLVYMDFAAARYNFNDGAMLRLSETIKDALDPTGILSPGKQGIWPKAFRNWRGYT